MGYAYPPVDAPTFTGDVITINRFLKDGPSVAKRAATLARMAFISDRLLRVPLSTENGTLTIESGRALGTADSARIVTPLGDYPLTTIGGGALSAVQTAKWGHDTKVSDESISRQKMNPVEDALKALVEQLVSQLDGAALAAIYTAVTKEVVASATITLATVEQILTDVFKAKAYVEDLKLGFSPDVAVLKPLDFAVLMAKFAANAVISEGTREDILAGRTFPTIQGVTFLPSSYATAGSMLIADSNVLGGVLKENLTSPGYSRANVEGAPSDIETKSMRLEENDGWRLRARRVCAPVILEPTAAVELTGIGTVTF